MPALDGLQFKVPNDAYWGSSTNSRGASLWGMKSAGAGCNAEGAWTTRTDCANVVVGVIDQGISWTHPDLVNNIWTNDLEISGNGVDDDGNGAGP